jgi:hypothetical protein
MPRKLILLLPASIVIILSKSKLIGLLRLHISLAEFGFVHGVIRVSSAPEFKGHVASSKAVKKGTRLSKSDPETQ